MDFSGIAVYLAIFFIVLIASSMFISVFAPLVLRFLSGYREKQARKINAGLEESFIWLDKKKLVLFSLTPLFLTLVLFIIWRNPISIIAGLIFSSLMPGLVLKFIRAQRIKKFSSQLIDALMILSSSLKGGLSLIQSIEVLCEEMPAPASQEFGLVLKENRMGISLEDSLKALRERIPTEELNLIVTSIMVARETGGELTVVFSRLTDTIRDNIKLKEKIATMTLQGRLQGIIMSFLPVVFTFFVWKQNPDHFDVMLQTDIGRGMIALAVVLQIVGMVIIKKVSTVRV